MSRDMTQKEFDAACERRGFTRQGFMGYYSLPCGTHVSVWNAGRRRRDQLAYLIREETRLAKAREESLTPTKGA